LRAQARSVDALGINTKRVMRLIKEEKNGKSEV
jgi:hypothetical protein